MGQTSTRVSPVKITPEHAEHAEHSKTAELKAGVVNVFTYLDDIACTRVVIVSVPVNVMTTKSALYNVRVMQRKNDGITDPNEIHISYPSTVNILQGLTEDDLDEVNTLFNKVLAGGCINSKLFQLKYKQCMLLWMLKYWLDIKPKGTYCCHSCDNVIKILHTQKRDPVKKLKHSLSAIPENQVVRFGRITRKTRITETIRLYKSQF